MTELKVKENSATVKSNIFSLTLLSSYIAGLINVRKKRSCEAIAKVTEESANTFRKYLNKPDEAAAMGALLMETAQEMIKKYKPNRWQKRKLKKLKLFHGWWLAVDETAILKLHAKYMEGLDRVYNSQVGRCEQGYSIIVLVITNGKIALPLAFDFYYTKEIAQNQFKSKSEKTEKLINLVNNAAISYDFIAADGAYSTEYLLQYLIKNKINFVMRIASNKSVKIGDKQAQLKNHDQFKNFSKNIRYKLMEGTWHEENYFFTAQKRKCVRRGHEIVFIISNMTDHSAYEYVQLYNLRWKIEVLFRTVKQSLGLADCYMLSIEKHTVHIYNVFAAYSFLQSEMARFKKKNSEQVIAKLLKIKVPDCIEKIKLFFLSVSPAVEA